MAHALITKAHVADKHSRSKLPRRSAFAALEAPLVFSREAIRPWCPLELVFLTSPTFFLQSGISALPRTHHLAPTRMFLPIYLI
jgi:hypothetical protein